jgi:hypothetical protein
MLTTEKATSILRALKPSKLEISDTTTKCEIGTIPVTIETHAFESYITIKASSYQATETSLSYPGYYEHAIEIQGIGPGAYRLFREADEITLQHPQTGFKIEVGPISSNFIMHMCDTDTMHRDFKRIMMIRRQPLRERENVSLKDMFSRTRSIKVYAPDGHPFYNNNKQLKAIAEAGLYHITYGHDVALIPIQSWERSLHFLDSNRRESVQFPIRTYNSELVAYYQMAISSESLILSFLAFYKILEYFFTGASEHLPHQKIKEHLVAPDFSHTKVTKLRELTKAIRAFDQKMNEPRMLQTVFEQYIDKEALRKWIEDFEKENPNYFTTERDIFGKSNRVDTTDMQLFPTVGTRIYQIRNALVHNKEGEISRFIPFSGQEKILSNEAPLLRRIVEELITKTGKDIQL